MQGLKPVIRDLFQTFIYAGFGSEEWHFFVLAGFFGVIMLLLLTLVFRLLGFRLPSKDETNKEEGPSHINMWQAGIVGGFWLAVAPTMFWLDPVDLLAVVALLVSLFVVTDKNVLWSTRRAGQLASELVSSTSDLSERTTELVDRVTALGDIKALPNMANIIAELTELFKKAAESDASAMLLAASPAIGKSGAQTEESFNEFRFRIQQAGTKLGSSFVIICYDESGREVFYRRDQKIPNQDIESCMAVSKSLIEELMRDCDVRIHEIPRWEDRDDAGTSSYVGLGGVHYLIVNWDKAGAGPGEAVLWHLGVGAKDQKIRGTGFWTRNHYIVQTFREVFTENQVTIVNQVPEGDADGGS